LAELTEVDLSVAATCQRSWLYQEITEYLLKSRFWENGFM